LLHAAGDANIPLRIESHGTLFQTYFTDREIDNYRDFATTPREAMVVLAELMLDRGVNMIPRGLWFLSTEHTDADVDRTIDAFADALADERLHRALAEGGA